MSVKVTKSYDITMAMVLDEFISLEATKPFSEIRAALNNAKML